MVRLSRTTVAQDWLAQFPRESRDLAGRLIDEVMLVSRDEFASKILSLIERRHSTLDAPRDKIALFAERPTKKVFGRIPAYFTNDPHGRAVGGGKPPIVVDPRNQEVGSEGIIAQLITDYCRRHPDTALNHPGPDLMRSARVGAIVIVTDCVGSGKRVAEMLSSLGAVRTLQSWRSFGWTKVEVIAYASTSDGKRLVEQSSLRPRMTHHVSCPTIATSFRGTKLDEIIALCRKYPPKHADAFGFGGQGTLIAFSHGCPNNAPALLHSRRSGWVPLFPGRTAGASADAFETLDAATLALHRGEALLRTHEARLTLRNTAWITAMLVLESVASGKRSNDDISARSHLSDEVVADTVKLAIAAGWLTQRLRLTELGRQEMRLLRRRRRGKPVFPNNPLGFYYPTQLRAP